MRGRTGRGERARKRKDNDILARENVVTGHGCPFAVAADTEAYFRYALSFTIGEAMFRHGDLLVKVDSDDRMIVATSR